MKTKWIHFIVFFALSITGCASLEPKGPIFSEAPTPLKDNSKAVIYLYRTDAIPNFASYREIHIDGKKLLTLNNGGFTWFTTDQKEVTIKSAIPWSVRSLNEPYNPPSLNLNLEHGKTYFVNLNIAIKILGENGQISYVGTTPIYSTSIDSDVKDHLIITEEETALMRLKRMKYETHSWQ